MRSLRACFIPTIGTCPASVRKFSVTFIALLIAAATGCSGDESIYFPLADGHWWYFKVETTVLDERREHRQLITNLGRGSYHGNAVYSRRQSTRLTEHFVRSPWGVEQLLGAQRATDSAIRSARVFPADLDAKEDWTLGSRLAVIESRTFARQDRLRTRDLPVELTVSVAATGEFVEVPAGRFSDCVKLRAIGQRSVRTDRGNATGDVQVQHDEWYAPGVGLVKVERVESSDSPFLKAGYYAMSLLAYGR